MSEPVPASRFDVICVGDIATDVYIFLTSDCVAPPGVVAPGVVPPPQPLLPVGAKLPYERSLTIAAGGNASNASVACARLGLRVALASYVGDDQLGRDLIAALRNEGVDTSLVRLDPDTATNRNFVLRLGQERTILVHHELHDYHWPHLRPSETPSWLYLTSVGRDGHDYEEQIADWLEANPSVQLAFQPGTFQLREGAERLARLYRRASLLVCNREEASTIGGADPADVEALLESLLELGPRRVVVTDSVRGAYAAEGDERYEAPIYPDIEPVVDRTGAGDAYAATILACTVNGVAFEEALLCAAVNAASVAHEIGTQAGLLHADELAARVAGAPGGFTVRSARPLVR